MYFHGLENAAALVGELPADSRVVDDATAADAGILFIGDSAALDRELATIGALSAAKAVWLCYPKGNATDINRDRIRHLVDAGNWQLVSNVSVDDTWSALRARFTG